jgi:hypothetical protein
MVSREISNLSLLNVGTEQWQDILLIPWTTGAEADNSTNISQDIINHVLLVLL